MWRIFYDADSGRVKYMIQAYGASSKETSPYIDVAEKVDINYKQVVEGKLVDGPVPPGIVFPTTMPK